MYKIALITLLMPAVLSVSGQNTEKKALYNGADFLTIAPNARAGAMGGIGVATTPDAYSIYWNAAKNVFNENKTEASFTYSPWMRELTKDMNLSALAIFHQIDNVQAISGGFRYFSYGDISFTDSEGVFQGENKPYEMSIDLSYSRKLGKNLSAAVTLKYIRSQLGFGQMVSAVELDAANSVAADISLFYNRNCELFGKNTTWSAGFRMANIGSKLKYGENSTEAYLPGDLRLGGAIETYFNQHHSLQLSAEVNTLMTPRYNDGSAPDKSGVSGYFTSFGDIRGENLFVGVGAEYWYARTLAVRAGYHYGNENSGRPSYASAGIGIQYFNILADVSYIAGISDNNLIRNSLQFTIGLNLDFFRKK